MNQTPMGLPILVLDTYVFLLVLDAVIFSLPHFISVIGDIPLGAPRPNALMKGI